MCRFLYFLFSGGFSLTSVEPFSEQAVLIGKLGKRDRFDNEWDQTVFKSNKKNATTFTVKVYFDKIKQLDSTSYTDIGLPTASFTPPKLH